MQFGLGTGVEYPLETAVSRSPFADKGKRPRFALRIDGAQSCLRKSTQPLERFVTRAEMMDSARSEGNARMSLITNGMLLRQVGGIQTVYSE